MRRKVDLSAPPSPPRTDHRTVVYAVLESVSVSELFTFELLSGVTNREASYRTVICCQRCNHDSILQFDAYSSRELVCVKCANMGSISMVNVSTKRLLVTKARQVQSMFVFSFRGFNPYRAITTFTKWSVKANKGVPIDFKERIVQVQWDNIVKQPKPREGGGFEWMPADAVPYCQWPVLTFVCRWVILNIGPVELNDVPPARSGPPVAGAEPSIQNGISSMPVTGKFPTFRTSIPLTGNLAKGRNMVPARNDIPDPNRLKAPFFSDEEIPKLSNRDDHFKVKDNPGALNVPARSSARKSSLLQKTITLVNGKFEKCSKVDGQTSVVDVILKDNEVKGRSRAPARNDIPDPNCLKVPFFSDEEIPKLSNRDDHFKVRDNPGALNVPARSSAGKFEKCSKVDGQTSVVDVNLKDNEVHVEHTSTKLTSHSSDPPAMHERGNDVKLIMPKLQNTEPSIQEECHEQ